jgi:hypothetical protein
MTVTEDTGRRGARLLEDHTRLNIKVPNDVYRELFQRAKSRGISPSSVARDLLTRTIREDSGSPSGEIAEVAP